MLGPRLTDARLWSVNRRSITMAFGAGVALIFIPLPIHIPLALLVAIAWRLNVPTILATLLLLNPLTVVPIYYGAYRLGMNLLQRTGGDFNFTLSWHWLANSLGAVWQPFLLGCLVAAVVGGGLAFWILEWIWRWSTLSRLGSRRSRVSR